MSWHSRTRPCHVPNATPPTRLDRAVYCEWVEGFGCLGTVPGKDGEDYINSRVVMEMCIQDTTADSTGCTTPDRALSWSSPTRPFFALHSH